MSSLCRTGTVGLLLASGLCTRALLAQELSLGDAQRRALAVSPDLRAAREAVTAAQARERQAGAFPNPTLSYAREQTSRGGRTNWQNIGLVEQPLDVGGPRGARQDAARFRVHAAEAGLTVAEADLRFDVARAYAEALAADRRAAEATAVAAIFARAREISQERLRQGDLSGYAGRRIALEAARYGALRAEALRIRHHARLALGALLAADGDSTAALEATLEAPVSPAPLPAVVDSLRALAFAQRPELRATRAEVAAGLADGRAARREAVPLPVVGLGFKQERAVADPASSRGFVLQLSLPLPLWDGRRGAAAAFQADSRQREAELAALHRRVAREVEQAWAAARAVEQEVELLRPQLGGEARAALTAAEAAYAEGEIALVEWLDAVRAYQEAEASFATLQAESLIQRAALERAVGTRLN